jgi:thiamine-phosphate pyrophosphorylase
MTVSSARRERRRRLEEGGVYLVTEERHSAGRRSEEIALAALEAGVGVVQVREKEGTSRRALEIARSLRAETRRRGALLIVNDRVDIALLAEADGVHVGQDDLPVAEVRRLVGPDALIGLSITAPEQLGAADLHHADYLGVGAVFPTDAKGDAVVTGLELVAAARRATNHPIVAIGGITVDRVHEVLAAGAHAVAVITAITLAPDPGGAARALLEAVAAARRRLATGAPTGVAPGDPTWPTREASPNGGGR